MKNSCPFGSRLLGSSCVDLDECEDNPPHGPCLNRGLCENHEDERMFECHCQPGFSGPICEFDFVPSGIISASSGFIIALLFCLFLMLSKPDFCLCINVTYLCLHQKSQFNDDCIIGA